MSSRNSGPVVDNVTREGDRSSTAWTWCEWLGGSVHCVTESVPVLCYELVVAAQISRLSDLESWDPISENIGEPGLVHLNSQPPCLVV